MNGSENCIKQLQKISDKNKGGEYSLGDILLLDRFESQLINYCGFTKEQVKEFSPAFYIR
jgi:hypothetical protein